MNISVPEEPTYYYEISSKNKRLLYWLPARTLKEMMNGGKVDKSILVDYPDGIDIKVTKDDFSYFEKKYKMVLDINPEKVWNAFIALWVQDKEKYRGVGYIEKTDLDPVVKTVNTELEKRGLAKQVPIAQEVDSTKRKQLHIQQIKLEKERLSLYRNIKVPKAIKGKHILKQFEKKVRMSKGDKPYKVFSAIQQHKV